MHKIFFTSHIFIQHSCDMFGDKIFRPERKPTVSLQHVEYRPDQKIESSLNIFEFVMIFLLKRYFLHLEVIWMHSSYMYTLKEQSL